MRPLPAVAADFVARHEGVRYRAYQDAGGVWTVGYGHTGPEVHAGTVITDKQALKFLEADLIVAASRLAAVVKREVIDALTENQYAALLSFVFNLGADPTWTIWKRLNARAFDEVPVQMSRFVYVGKVKVKGLVNRRAAEVALWSTAEPGSVEDDAPPSSVTRDEVTPPASMALPASQSKSIVTTCAATVATAGVAVGEVIKAVTPYATQSPLVGHAVSTLAIVAAGLAAAGALFVFLKNRQAAR